MKFTTVLPILLLPTSVTANRDLFKKIRANDNTEFGRDDTAEFGVSPKQTKNGRNLRTRSLQLDLSMSMPDFEAASMSLPNVPTYAPTAPNDTPTYFPTALDGSTNKDKVSVVDTVHGAVDTVDGAVDTVGDAVDTVGDAVDTVDAAVDTVGDAVDTVSDVVSKLDGVLSWISGFFGRRN